MSHPIKHLVVLMLENRSFAHMLGFLPGVNGLDPSWTNPLTSEGPQVQVSPDARTVHDLDPDPGHEWINVNMQIFENLNGTGTPTMKGFVEDYLLISKDKGQAPNIMKCFTPNTLPVLSTLAQQYAVCDRWFSSVPGPTIPNRLFTHAAQSEGSLTQDAVAAPFVIRTIFEDMDVPPNPANYRIYTYGSSILMVNRYLQQNKQDHFFDFADFETDAVKGYLPEYTFIEPAFDDDVNNGIYANSQHPDFAVDEGEALISAVYSCLCDSPDWDDTLFLITYDEHGGIVDHVVPPTLAPSPANAGLPDVPPSTSPGFDFRRLGVRVPTVFVSPQIAPNTVISDRNYEHCSIVATVRKLFCGPNAQNPFNWREAQAPTFENLLTLDTPRPDVQLPAPIASSGPSALQIQASAQDEPPSKPSDLMLAMVRAMNYSLEQRGITPPADVANIQTAQEAVDFMAVAKTAAGGGA
ncbi:MAG: alkaline phosphatase family protein [Candidatus Sulfotelmatobacter sp.]